MIEQLISVCSHLRVSPAAAEAFSRNAERLAFWVGRHLEADTRAPALLDPDLHHLLLDSRNNRVSLLKFVFRVNAWDLLSRTVCWDYRAQHARGIPYDYFALEWSAWRRATQQLERSCGRELSTIFDWLIEHHESVIKVSNAGEGLEAPDRPDLNSGQNAFLTLLLKGDSREAMALAQRAVGTVPELKKFYVNVICPALHRVGMLWEANVLSVPEEHLCTAIVGRIMTGLYVGLSHQTAVPGKVALVAAGPNELHEVGARMVADYLELGGWRVKYLGGNLSVTELLSAAKLQSPFLVTLSVSSVFNLDATRQLVQAMKADPETNNIRVILGGYVFNCLPGLRNHFEADDCQKEPDGVILSANTWWEQGPR
jgi:MerR family transcriptional regulator, light-induced transcriptional regulator